MDSAKPVYAGKDLEGMSFAPRYHQWILESFADQLGRRVAEVGGGCGNFTRLLASDPCLHVTSFEPSGNMFPQLASLRKDFGNLSTFNTFLKDKADEMAASFDSVLYINVLEHIEDDRGELENARKVLRHNGKLIIFVPALSVLYSRFDSIIGHYRRYHKQALQDLVTSCGFRVEKVAYFDIAGIIPWYLVFVLLKSGTIPRSVSLYDNWVVPLMKRVEALAAPPVGKNLLLVASKIQ